MNRDHFIKLPGPEMAAMARVFAGGVVISFSPVLFKVSGATPSAASLWRTTVGGLFLLAIALFRKERPFAGLKSPGTLRLMALCGFLFTLDLEFWHRSIPYVGPGMATIITNFQAIILAFIGVLFLREKPSVRLAVSVMCALAGLWLLVGVDLSALPPDIVKGVAWGLGAALWYSLYILGVRQSQGRTGRLPAVTNMAWISLATALLVALTGIMRGSDFSPGGTRGMLLLVVYGVGPQAMGWLLISSGLPGFRASVAGLIILIQPTLAFIWDILFFHRPAGPTSLAGAALALAAIYIGATGRKPAKKKQL